MNRTAMTRPAMTGTGHELNPLKRALREHEVYGLVDGRDELRLFSESHVFAVLDFMSLLKSLQAELTCVRVPWTPPRDRRAARLIGEIVLGEECDEVRPGETMSHFEWYLEAMEEIGADTGPVQAFVAGLERGREPLEWLERAELPPESAAFLRVSFRLLHEPLHVRAAAFYHGREDVIPSLFLPLVRRLRAEGLACEALLGYLERHIELDGGSHGPLMGELVERLTGGAAALERQAVHGARLALRARLALWDGIRDRLRARSQQAAAVAR